MSKWLPKKYQGHFNSLQKNILDDMWERFIRMPSAFNQIDDAQWFPAADIDEKEDHVILTAELPGIDPDDVEVSVTKDLVTIKGEKKMEEESDKMYERYFGSFQRSFRLNSEVDGDSATADYKNGVLKVHLPKSEPQSRTSIKINS